MFDLDVEKSCAKLFVSKEMHDVERISHLIVDGRVLLMSKGMETYLSNSSILKLCCQTTSRP